MVPCYPKQPAIVITRAYWTVIAVTEATDAMNQQQEFIAAGPMALRQDQRC